MSKAESPTTGHTCPFCGSGDCYPDDGDSWLCLACKKSHPTQAFKCRAEGCWGWAVVGDYCDLHTPSSGTTGT